MAQPSPAGMKPGRGAGRGASLPGRGANQGGKAGVTDLVKPFAASATATATLDRPAHTSGR